MDDVLLDSIDGTEVGYSVNTLTGGNTYKFSIVAKGAGGVRSDPVHSHATTLQLEVGGRVR